MSVLSYSALQYIRRGSGKMVYCTSLIIVFYLKMTRSKTLIFNIEAVVISKQRGKNVMD